MTEDGSDQVDRGRATARESPDGTGGRRISFEGRDRRTSAERQARRAAAGGRDRGTTRESAPSESESQSPTSAQGRARSTAREDRGRSTSRERGTVGDAGVAPRVRRQYSPPPALTDRYVYVRDINAGSQAAVLLCTERATGRQVAVKYYLGADGMVDTRVFEALEGGDRRHVVPSRIESGDGEQWEVMEFFPLGSLHDVLEERKGVPFGPDVTRAFVRQLTEALVYLHARQVVHRDLKPGNILVRSVDPLDVVIGDFGVSIRTAGTAAASVRGTWAYAAPEASYGEVSGRGDWWSLGMMAFELLAGHHVLADPQTRLTPNDQQMRMMIGRGELELPGVADPRWQLLLSGLLTREQKGRWTDRQVQEWLSGRSPKVWRSSANPPSTSPGYRTAQARSKPVVVGDRAYTDPAELTGALTANWSEAMRKLAGRELEDIRALLLGGGVDERTVTACLSRPSPTLILLALQGSIRPGRAPVFQGRPLDGGSLALAADAAQGGAEDAGRWIGDLRRRGVLGEMTRYARDGAALAIADERLTAWWREVKTWEPTLRAIAEISGELDALKVRWEGELLAAALDDVAAAELRRRGRRAGAATGPFPAWSEGLRAATTELRDGRSTGTGSAAVAAGVLGPAVDLERARILAEEQAERDLARAQERERQVAAVAARRALATARRSSAGRRFRGRLAVVPVYAAVAAVASAVPVSSVERLVQADRFWLGAAFGAASVLFLSIGVYAAESAWGPVRLAARRHLLAGGIILSIVLWCVQLLDASSGSVRFPTTPYSWWVVPPLICAAAFLMAAGLSASIGPRVAAADEARNVEGSWTPMEGPRWIRRLVPVLTLTVAMAGAALATQLIQVLSVATGGTATPLSGLPVPSWAWTISSSIDQALPNLPLPDGLAARTLVCAAIFVFGLIMTRLYSDLCRASNTVAGIVVGLALAVNVLLAAMPGDLVQGLTVVVMVLIGIALVLLILWFILAVAFQ